MMTKKTLLGVVGALVSLVGGAEEVVIDPGAGVTYEQTEPITGDKSVRIKSGIITLNSANAYTGQTAATNAQLIVRADVVPGETSPVGTQGPVILSGPATIRAEGNQPILWTLPLTNDFFREDIINDSKIGTNRKNGSTWGVVCFDTQSDLTLGGAFGADYGGFAKIGPGALHLATPSGKTLAKCNNSAPPSHYNTSPFVLENGVVKNNTAEAFSIYDGSVYMDALTPSGAKAKFTIDASKGYCYIGGMTAGEGEQEKSPYLEVNGSLTLSSEFCTPWNNGFAGYNTPEGPTHPIVRVKNGGTLTLASSKGVNIGLNLKSGSSFKYRSNCEPEIIVEKGGTLSHTTSTSYRWLLPHSGGHRVKVTVNGTMKLPILSSSNQTDAYQKTDPSDTSLDFIVGEGGVSSCARFAPDIQNTGFPNRFVVADGGQFTLGLVSNIQSRVNYSFAVTNGGILTVSGYDAATCVEPAKAEFLFDDGSLLGSKDKINLFAPGSTIRIGKGGLTAKVFSSSAYTAYLNAPVSSADGCEGTDGGLTLCPGSASAVLVVGAAMSYAGPTTLQKGTLALGANGTLPANGDLVFAGGNLVATNGENVTVRNLTFADGKTTTLKLLSGKTFTATGTVSVGDGVTLKFAFLDEAGADVTPTTGELALLSVPEAAAGELEKFAVVGPVDAAVSVTGRRVAVAEGVAKLMVSLTTTAAMTDGWTNPAGGAWSVGGNWGNGVALPDWGTAQFNTSSQDGGATITADGAKASKLVFASGVGGYTIEGNGFVVGPFNGSAYGNVTFQAESGLTIGAPGAADNESVDWAFGTFLHDRGHLTFNSGRITVTNNFSIAGSWVGDGTSTDEKKALYATYSPSFTMNGGTIDCGVRFYNRGNPLFGPSTFTMNGGRIHAGVAFQCSRSASFTKEVSTNIFNGGTIESDGNIYLGYHQDVMVHSVLNEGATLRFGGSLKGGYGKIYDSDLVCNGGTIVPTGSEDPSDKTYLRYFESVKLGEKGLRIDMSEYAPNVDSYFNVLQKFVPDPSLAEGTTDGGVVVSGRGTSTLLLGSAFMQESTFVGPVHATDGAAVEINTGVVPCPFVFDGGTFLSFFPTDSQQTTHFVKTPALTLGGVKEEPVDYVLNSRFKDTGLVSIVADALAVAGPVRVWTVSRTDNRLATDIAPGEYVLFAYDKTKSGALDLSKITLADVRYFEGVVTEVDVTEGDLAGYTLVKMTVQFNASKADGKWISTSAGGAWSGVANWDGAVPNGDGKTAYFNPAEGVGVPVSVDAPVTVGTLTFGGAAGTANGYVLSGGTLTLADSLAPVVNNFGGTNTISASLAVPGEALALNTATGTALRVNLNGVAATVAANDTIGEVTAGGNVELATAGFVGKLVTHKGRTVVDDLSFVETADDLVLGPSTLRYEGGNVEIPGLTVNVPSAAAGVLDVADADTTVALDGLAVGETGRSTFIKYGPGTLHLKGTGEFLFKGYKDSTSSGRTTLYPNGDSPTCAIRAFNVDDGTVVVGTKDDPNDAPTITADMFVVGRKHPTNGSVARFIMNNGTVNALGYTSYLHYYPGNTTDAIAAIDEFTVNGGEMNLNAFTMGYNGSSYYKRGYVFTQNGGVVNVNGLFRARYARTQTYPYNRHLHFNGGTFNVGGDFDAGFVQGTCNTTTPSVPLPLKVWIDGGEVNVGGNYILSTNAPSFAGSVYTNRVYSRLYLNSGVLKAKNIVAYALNGEMGTMSVSFNGGTYAPTAAGTLGGLRENTLVVSTNGAVITTANVPTDGVYAIADPLVHDGTLAGTDGGLVKEGAGTLALAARNTYDGPTVVKAGLLRVDGTASISDTLVLAGGAVSLAAGGAFARVEGAGAIAGSVETAAVRPAAAGALVVTGDFSCAKRLVVDLANRPDAKVGDVIELATVSGAVNLQERCKVINATGAKSGLISVENGVVRCTLCDFGMVLLVK